MTSLRAEEGQIPILIDDFDSWRMLAGRFTIRPPRRLQSTNSKRRKSYRMIQPRAVLLNDTSSFNHHGCHIVMQQVRQWCKEHDLKLWHTVKLGDDWRAENHQKRLAQSQIVIVNGEGSFHHDRKSALILAQSAAFCRDRNIPCVLINSVYQGNGPEMAHFVRQFHLVFVRETLSQAELGRLGIASEVVPDLTLSHPNLSEASRNGMIITDSSDDDATSQLGRFFTQVDGAELASLFRPISTAHALRMLTARMFGKRAPKRWRFEQSQFSRSRPHPFSAAPLDPTHVLLNRVSSATLIVTGRFHLVCLALLARTPFIALRGNTHKIEGMLADANLLHRYRSSPPDDLDLSRCSEWRDDELAHIENFLGAARPRISNMFFKIRELLACWILTFADYVPNTMI